MLSSNAFIRQSLEAHIFFARIMKEHSFFLQIGFTSKDVNFVQQADHLTREFDKVLWEVVCLSKGIISSGVIHSGEVVTPYTLGAETMSSYYTGVDIATYITQAEMELTGGEYRAFNPMLEQTIYMLNQRTIPLITAIIDFKTNVLTNVLSCNIFTMNYPSLITHILREAELYRDTIIKLQNRESIDTRQEMYEQELLWNEAMGEHAEFIRGLLDPPEKELIKEADEFTDEFSELVEEVKEAMENCLPLDKITDKSLEATKRVSNFKAQATKGLLDCEIRSIIIPLLGDHVLREANHFVRLLKAFQRMN